MKHAASNRNSLLCNSWCSSFTQSQLKIDSTKCKSSFLPKLRHQQCSPRPASPGAGKRTSPLAVQTPYTNKGAAGHASHIGRLGRQWENGPAGESEIHVRDHQPCPIPGGRSCELHPRLHHGVHAVVDVKIPNTPPCSNQALMNRCSSSSQPLHLSLLRKVLGSVPRECKCFWKRQCMHAGTNVHTHTHTQNTHTQYKYTSVHIYIYA